MRKNELWGLGDGGVMNTFLMRNSPVPGFHSIDERLVWWFWSDFGRSFWWWTIVLCDSLLFRAFILHERPFSRFLSDFGRSYWWWTAVLWKSHPFRSFILSMNNRFRGSGPILVVHTRDELPFWIILSYFGLSFCMSDQFRLSGAILVVHTDDELPVSQLLSDFGSSYWSWTTVLWNSLPFRSFIPSMIDRFCDSGAVSVVHTGDERPFSRFLSEFGSSLA